MPVGYLGNFSHPFRFRAHHVRHCGTSSFARPKSHLVNPSLFRGRWAMDGLGRSPSAVGPLLAIHRDNRHLRAFRPRSLTADMS